MYMHRNNYTHALLNSITAVDLHLPQNAFSVVTEVELAVSWSAIPIHTPMYVPISTDIG